MNERLKDICARIPYGVKVKYKDSTYDVSGISCIRGIYFLELKVPGEVALKKVLISSCCPYLRSLTSMTAEEKTELEQLRFRYTGGCIINEDVSEYDDYRNHPYIMVDETKCSEVMEFLNSHHFDYMDLIPKGLALEANENMYKS